MCRLTEVIEDVPVEFVVGESLRVALVEWFVEHTSAAVRVCC